jgi:hopanoid biosynthesis associated protein HpnK
MRPVRCSADSSRRVIFTADDFGAALSVNEAVELAHRSGVLSTASLMVGGPAASDAVARAKRMPQLRVGLHVVVTDGRPILDPSEIPDLVDHTGRLSSRLLHAGLSCAVRPGARRQLRAEIEAQFAAFAGTGLRLDHANGHNHFHVHPVVLGLILETGRRYGLRAVRIPYEPFGPSWRATRTAWAARMGYGVALRPVVAAMQTRIRRAGLACNDYLFGIADTGRMTADLVLRLLEHLPPGVSEFHFHPATGPWPAMPPGAQPEAELSALTDGRVARTLQERGIRSTTFHELGSV